MSRLIYSFSVSLDGYIAGPDGSFEWAAPDEELHRFHNQQTRELDAHLLGRRLYETMVFWETAEQDPTLPEHMAEFAEIWRDLPRVVFSRTLDQVEGNARLVRDGLAEEVEALKQQSEKDIGVGGAGLAAACIDLGLVDEYQLFVYPVLVGGDTPFFPPGLKQADLQLLETQTFGEVVYLRYENRDGSQS